MKKVTQDQVRSALSKKFIKSEKVADALFLAYSTQKNVFLYGRGGHAKSEMTEEFLSLVDPKGQLSFVQSCGEGMTEEKLFGGINLQKFNDTGEIEYLVERSFMNYEVVVFEELLDSRMNVLLSLKDILTSGKFRQGSQTFDIKTKMVIVNTNRTKQEVAEDNSIRALMERFPIEMKVEWDSYHSADYEQMYRKVLGKPYRELASTVAGIVASGHFISPRQAIHMANCYDVYKFDSLEFIGLPQSIQKDVREKIEEEKIISQLIDSVSVCRDDLDALFESYHEASTPEQFKKVYASSCGLMNEIAMLKTAPQVDAELAELKKGVTTIKNQSLTSLIDSI